MVDRRRFREDRVAGTRPLSLIKSGYGARRVGVSSTWSTYVPGPGEVYPVTMARSRRKNIYRFQGHAVLDAAGRCTGRIPHIHDYDVQLPSLPCPTCLRFFPYQDLEEEHAPQQAGQSNLGEPHVVVLTCHACNYGAGATYEMSASRDRSLLDDIPDGICQVHQPTARTPSGLIAPRDINARTLTDLKTAYLIACATLGYAWVASGRLDRLREVLRGNLTLPYAACDYDTICGCEDLDLSPFQVAEVLVPVPAVIVFGARAGIVLPCDSSPTDINGRLVRRIGQFDHKFSATLGRRFDWPRNYDHGGTVEQAWDDPHGLFHYDRCFRRPSDHAGFALAAQEVATRLGVVQPQPQP